MKPYEIKALDFFSAESPLSRPIADATHQIPAIRFLVARLTLADGTVGEGYLLAFHFSPHAICGTLADVRELALGREACATREFNRACDEAFEYFGEVGLLRWARGVVNVAMWDAWARHLKTPVWRLLGTHGSRVPAYGSGGWLSYSIDELVAEANGYVRRGFTAVKLKVGSPDRERDVERIARVREAVGPQVRIMIDANQGFDYPGALALARRAAAYGIHWFEEPLPHTNFDGYAAGDFITPDFASNLVWFDALLTNPDRTHRNPNLLIWERKPWLIDHGSALYAQHTWGTVDDERTRSPFPLIKDHVLLAHANDVLGADTRLAHILTDDVLHAVLAAVPDDLLMDQISSDFPDAESARARYHEYLSRRLGAPRSFVAAAIEARTTRAAEPPRRRSARR